MLCNAISPRKQSKLSDLKMNTCNTQIKLLNVTITFVVLDLRFGLYFAYDAYVAVDALERNIPLTPLRKD